MATPLQIGGLINLEERSGSFLPELPYTNRGVIRQKEKLVLDRLVSDNH